MKKLNLPFQVSVTRADKLELTARGLLVPESVPHRHEGVKQATKNCGDVVSHRYLGEKTKAGEVSQKDARKLLVIEAKRKAGSPRERHLNILAKLAFDEDKQAVMEAVPAYWRAQNKEK